MSKLVVFILLSLFCGVLISCKNTQFLQDGEVLYTGLKKPDITRPKNNMDDAFRRTELILLGIYAKPNNSLFGLPIRQPLPIGLWTYNYIKRPHLAKNANKEYSRIGKWFFKQFSQAPVLMSSIDPLQRVGKIQKELFNLGHFNAKADYKIYYSKKRKKAKIKYTIEYGTPFTFSRVFCDTNTTFLNTVLMEAVQQTEILDGQYFDLSKIENEKIRISTFFQNKGFFFFKPNYIQIDADTAVGDKKINLYYKLRNVPQEVAEKLKIDQIYFLFKTNSDYKKIDKVNFHPVYNNNDMIWIDSLVLKNKHLFEYVKIKSNTLYSIDHHNQTILNIENLNYLKNLRINYIKKDSSKLDVIIQGNPSKKIATGTELNYVAKSNDFHGPGASLFYTDRNLFGGAEVLNVKLYGSLESLIKSASNQTENKAGVFSYELGIGTSIKLPYFIFSTPLDKITQNHKKFTKINLDFKTSHRIQYYKLNNYQLSIDFNWNKARNTYQLTPVLLNFQNITEKTDLFKQLLLQNNTLKRSFEETFILGSSYRFIQQYSKNNYKQNKYFFDFQIETAGNLLNLAQQIGGKQEEKTNRRLFKVTYAQYVKFDADLRWKHKTGKTNTIVSRLYFGLGLPYGNSTVLPYQKQFFSGGPNGIRAFRSRGIGPGTYKTEGTSRFVDQTGDIKLEFNIETRFKISRRSEGALFLDAGNVWLTKKDKNKPGAELNIKSIKDIAIGTGIGIRYNLKYLILRVDYGIALREPSLPKNERWMFSTSTFKPTNTLHFAIGYPF